jgi:hypothetical protein
MSRIRLEDALQDLARELIHAQARSDHTALGRFEIVSAEVGLSIEPERRSDGSIGYTVASRAGRRSRSCSAQHVRLLLSLREAAAHGQMPGARSADPTSIAARSANDCDAVAAKQVADRRGAIEPLTADHLRRRIIDTFSSGYLTVIAIIQGVALGILLTTAQSHFSKQTTLVGHLAVISQALATFAAIVIVTHQYLILTALVRWTPTSLDTAIPYALGVGEIGASLVIGGNTLWWASYSVLMLAGVGAFSYSLIRGTIRVFGGLSDFHKQYREGLHQQIVACAVLALGCIALSSLSFVRAMSEWVYAIAPVGVLAGGIVVEILGDRDPEDIFVNNGIPWWRFRSTPEERGVSSAGQETTVGAGTQRDD